MPQSQTVDRPTRLPLIVQAENRDATGLKDARLVNCYAELSPVQNEYQIEKRFGMSPQSNSVNNEAGRGILPFGAIVQQVNQLPQFPLLTDAGGGQVHIWAYVGHAPFPPVWQIVQTITGGIPTTVSVGEIPATQTQPAQYIFGFGTTAYVNKQLGAGNVPVTDVNYPASTVPGFVYLDGTTYVMGAAGAIYGSLNLNDATAWDPLNVIFAQARPDLPIALAIQLTYVVAIKSTSTQFFYDAGNPTGSPLSPVPGALLNYGCVSADTVQTVDDMLLWVTSNIDSTPQVLLLRNLQPTIVSTPAIERRLETGSNNNQYISFGFKLAGHKFYGVSNIQANVTFVYDITSQLWYEWTDANGNYYPVMAVQSGTIFETQSTVLPPSLVVQLRTTGQSYILTPDYITANDNGVVFTVEVVTPNFDGGTDRRKMMNVMWVNADQTKGSVLSMSYSDDDYKKWSIPRYFDLGIDKPMLTGFGTFTKRAHRFRHSSNTPLRLRSIGLQLDVGTL